MEVRRIVWYYNDIVGVTPLRTKQHFIG
jgi:hypothetical protein